MKTDWEQWLEKGVETLYKKDTANLINSKLKSEQIIQKHISMLEATKANDQVYFWKDVCRANLLAYLYLRDAKRRKDAKELIRKSLEIEPTSFAALANNFRLAKVEKRSQQAKEVFEKLNSLETSEDAKALHIVARAEVAYCLEYLGPDFYMLSIEKYEKSLSDLNMLTEEEKTLAIINNKQRMWQYHLAQTYNRMMNRGNTTTLFSKRYDRDLRDVFKKTTHLLVDIIDSKDETYHGKALVDLVDFYKKYETNGGDIGIKFPYKNGPDDCIKEAYNLGTQKDPYVLEKCGRHYRQRAKYENEFLFAAKVLQEAIDLCETRHVTWHQMGLTYRSLWLNAGRYKESRLHTNRAREGNTKKRKRKIQQDGVNYSVHGIGSGTAEHTKRGSANSNPSNNIQQRPQNSPGKKPRDETQSRDSGNNSTVTESESITENANNKTLLLHSRYSHVEQSVNISKPQRPPVQSGEKEQLLTTPPPPLPTLKPKYPITLGSTPRHQNKADYQDKYRVSNPQIQQNGVTDKATDYFHKAVECLKKATKLVNDTSCRYLLDLGRLYVSQDKFSEAEECFQLAEEAKPNDNDAQYLFEQWALLREKHQDSNEAEDIKKMYRDSIRSALKANVKSKVAFYNLRKILEEEKKMNPDDETVHSELAVLLCDVHKFNQAEEMLKNFLASLKNDPTKVDIIWRLVALYHQRGQKHDAAAAYTYLTALEKAEQLHLEVDKQRKQRIRIMIELAGKDFQENETETKLKSIRHLTLAPEESPESHDQCTRLKPNPYFKDVFRWAVGNKTLSERGFTGMRDKTVDDYYKETDICLVAFDHIQTETDTTSARLLKLLQDWCDLGEGVSCLPNDMGSHHPSDQAATAILSKAKAVVIVLDDRSNEMNEDYAQIVQEMIVKLKRLKLTKNICFVVGGNLDSEYCSEHFVLNQECTDCCIATSFLQYLFCPASVQATE